LIDLFNFIVIFFLLARPSRWSRGNFPQSAPAGLVFFLGEISWGVSACGLQVQGGARGGGGGVRDWCIFFSGFGAGDFLG
jgi:hypothetical protein